MHTSIIYCITEHSASWFARNWVSRTHSTAYVTKTTSTAGQLRRNSRGIIFSMLKMGFRSKFRFILLQFIYYAGLICTVGSTISSTRQYWRSFSSVFFSSPPTLLSHLSCFHHTNMLFLVICYLVDSSVVYHLLHDVFFFFNFFFLSYLFIYSMFGIFFYFGAMPSSFTFSFIAHSYFCTWAKVLSIYFFFVFRENMGKSMGCGSGDVEVKRKRDREHGL